MIKRSFRIIAASVLAVALAAGCASSGKNQFATFYESPLETAKRPEVIVAAANRQQMTDALSTRMRSSGWTLHSDSANLAIYRVAGLHAIGFLTDVSTEVEATSAYRLTCRFSTIEEGFKVVGTLEISTDPDAATPNYQELINWDARAKVQEILDSAKSMAPSFPISQVVTPEG